MDASFAPPEPPVERPRAPTAARALLSQCKALACSRLSAILVEALDKVEHDLSALAEESATPVEQQVLLEAMAQLRTHRSEIAQSFDRCFAEVFEQRVFAPRPLTASQELNVADLALVDDATMEESLAINELARKTKNRIDPDQMLGIQARFGHLLAHESLDDEGNPLSPDAVFQALKQACAHIPADFAVKRSLLSAVQPYIASGIDKVYVDVNQNLIAHHVLPRIRHQVQRAADKPAGTSQPVPLNPALGASQALHTSQLMNLSQLMPPGVAPAMAMSAQLDLSTLLAGALNGPPAARRHAARLFSDPNHQHFDHLLDTPATPSLLASLSQLQSGLATTGREPGELLTAIDQQVRSQSHPLDQLTIELVTMVFDYILGDRDVADTVKAELARLQIVAVKAALLDRTFFARRQHPMRRLLDRVSEAAQDPDIDTRADSAFLLGLRTLIGTAIESFVDDLAVFELAQEQLAQLVANTTRAQRQAAASAVSTLAQEERLRGAKAEARAALRERVTRKTPEFVRDFLYTWWARALARARATTTPDEALWNTNLEIADALIWSVLPLKRNDVQRLAALLPDLMRGLLAGMNAVAMPAEPRQAFFNQLMQAHTEAVHAAKNTDRAAQPEEPSDAATPSQGELPETEPTGPDEKPTSAGDFDIGDLNLHVVRTLERGAVLEFHTDEGLVRSKLTWISPRQTILLFTSGGTPARHYSPEALAAMLQSGQAQIIEARDALLDRAFDALLGEAPQGA